METITKTYKVYKIDELTEKAQEKARKQYNDDIEYPFLQANLRENIHEELKEAGYTELSTIIFLYSLSHCQGDGLMFEGTIADKKGNTYTIKHSGHYYHERSTTIEARNKKGDYLDHTKWNESFYVPLCNKIAQRGYDEIEWLTSMENFIETCEANEYVFLEDGTLFIE